MKAIVYTETGDPSVLKLVERAPLEPGPGEVRVRIAVSGVNPTDWKSRSGGEVAFPEVVPHLDAGGVVDAVGPGVEGLAVGDRVWTLLAGYQHRSGGTAQESTVLQAERVAKLPDNASFDVGASLGVPALTAHRALTVGQDGPTRLAPGALDGQLVLVAGGAGAVGHAAIQLARWAGATVITTISGPEKAQLASAAGAHHVVNYREGGTAEKIRAIAPDGVDLVAEVAPGVNAALNAAVLRNHGTVSIYANDGGPSMTLEIIEQIPINARHQFLLVYTLDSTALAAGIADVNAALADGALPVGVEAGLPLIRFALEQTAEAQAAVEAGAVGKVVVDVAAL
ncbi:MAG TPA: NADPH:quinone reductase [Conexibacter sp.]|jgi:NADPH2:quinone reductase